MRIDDDETLRYYWQELAYLRQAGQNFARKYPKIAGRLELEPNACPDPHVERLLEAFAFQTARIQKGLDEDFPEIASELLGILYPHLASPVPSMSVARFEVDPERGKLTTGYRIPARTGLFSPGAEGNICRFRTGYDVDLWPVEVRDVDMVLPDTYRFLERDSDVAQVLRIRLEAPTLPFYALEMKSLRFFLQADPVVAALLYEVVMSQVLRVVLLGEGNAPIVLPKTAIAPVGFGDEHEVLPYPPHAQPAYRLLQEYFAFPEKYHFFELGGFERTRAGKSLDILLLLDRTPKGALRLAPETFSLGCTPIVNLFPRTTEPIRWDQRRLEYLLVPDSRRHRTTEIHSVAKVTSAAHPDEPARVYHPFYSFSHEMQETGQKAFWHARRIATPHPDGVGSDLSLSFLDLDFRPSRPADEVIYAHTLCTNRDLAEQVPADSLLQCDRSGMPVGRIVCLRRPTRQGAVPARGQNLWRLVSHLSLNYLSGEKEGNDAGALREILRLYDFSGSVGVERQLGGVRKISTRPVIGRIGRDAWRGFAQGREVELVLDETTFSADTSPFLFASVLEQFFALYAATNSFSQMVLRSETREGVWHRWPARAGRKIVG